MVLSALKYNVEERWGKQGSVERKKSEGTGTSKGIQGHGVSQEMDDDNCLPDESSAKRKRKSKKKKTGDQGVSASKTVPWAQGKGNKRGIGRCGCGNQIRVSTDVVRCRTSR